MGLFKKKDKWIHTIQTPAHKVSVSVNKRQNILMTGWSPISKEKAFDAFLKKLRETNQSAIVITPSMEELNTYYREGKDILLNPFDEKSAGWHPWCECHSDEDLKNMARSIIALCPKPPHEPSKQVAEQMLYNALKKLQESRSLKKLKQTLVLSSREEIKKFFQDTEESETILQALEDPDFLSLIVISLSLSIFRHVPDTETPFSIRKWVEQKDDSWLFLSCSPPYDAHLRPLLTLWTSLIFSAALKIDSTKTDSTEESLMPRKWVVTDHLLNLEFLPDLKDFLSKTEAHGLCSLLALQHTSHIKDVYGESILESFSSYVHFKEVFDW